MTIATATPGPRSSLPLLLRRLKLPSFVELHVELAAKAAADAWTFETYLQHLAEQELADRDRRRIERNLKQSRLPSGQDTRHTRPQDIAAKGPHSDPDTLRRRIHRTLRKLARLRIREDQKRRRAATHADQVWSIQRNDSSAVRRDARQAPAGSPTTPRS
jgi:hypothetical protein